MDVNPDSGIFGPFIGIGMALFSLLVAVVIFSSCLIPFQNRSYARNYFSNKVAYDKVLASRKWHPLVMGKPLDCSYAIVSLYEGAPHYPPVHWLGHVAWSQTPVVLTHSTHLPVTSNPVSACAEMNTWSTDITAKLQAAVKEPDSFFCHSGETLLVYSKTQKIAACVRYGD